MSEGSVSAAIEIYLTVNNGLEAIEFYKKAFGAYVVYQELNVDKTRVLHAPLAAFGGHIMLSDHFPEFLDDVARRRVGTPAARASLR